MLLPKKAVEHTESRQRRHYSHPPFYRGSCYVAVVVGGAQESRLLHGEEVEELLLFEGQLAWIKTQAKLHYRANVGLLEQNLDDVDVTCAVSGVVRLAAEEVGGGNFF